MGEPRLGFRNLRTGTEPNRKRPRLPRDLETLFRLHHRELRHMAYGGVRCSATAEDILQDAFLRYAGSASAASVANPYAFLCRIVANLVRDERRVRRNRGHLLPLEDAEACPAAEISQERRLADRQALAILVAALHELPHDCRRALLLNRLDGFTHAEIGQRLGISTSMVTKHIIRALRHCQRRLSPV